MTSIWCGSATAETTLCTEITSVPVTIKAQGIYCFKKDLTSSVASGNIIQINASNVTIDMNGRKLGGFTAGANTQAVGIAATNRRNITLRNGTVQGFRRGIVIDGTTDSTGYVLEDLRIEGNTQTGIEVGGTNGIVRNNLVTNTGLASLVNNTAIGILLKDSSRAVVRGNLISYVLGTSQARGVSVNGSSMVEISDNTILDVGAAYGGNFGIHARDTTAITVAGNRLLNLVSNYTSIGFYESELVDGFDCYDNSTRGYQYGQSGCDFSVNNQFH
ncbi:hypothetical protein BSQ44_23005 [Aquibium oceanicum]|uniref:Right handed beta helix domain-containing protein n=1 Tax=Aquibium oceanicum TaxID=1670800 RepID=A0A1L3SX39_9HYPH|nr:hypothetical protein BSQ44_23005 [Aquibium oceanicum]